MKLVRRLTLVALGLGTLGTAVSLGCGGTSSSGNGDGGSKESGAGDSGGGASANYPVKSGSPTSQTTAQNFAIHQLYLGDTDYGGNPGGDMNAWMKMGYNIDGKITTASSTNVCTLQSGATPSVQVDGTDGVDNSFGVNIYEGILLGVDPTASSTILTDVAAGAFTLMFDIVGLDSTSTQTATGLSAQAFAGGKFSATGSPTWTTADNWPVLGGSLLSSTSPPKSTIQFPDAYVVNGTWVSGSPVTIPLDISIDGITVAINISGAVITFDHSSPTHGGNGIISGVIELTQLEDTIKGIAGFAGLCDGAEVTSILGEIAKASDIQLNGSTVQNNPGSLCNAISVGIGFQVDQIAAPTTVAAAGCPKASMCDAGAPVDCDGGT